MKRLAVTAALALMALIAWTVWIIPRPPAPNPCFKVPYGVGDRPTCVIVPREVAEE